MSAGRPSRTSPGASSSGTSWRDLPPLKPALMPRPRVGSRLLSDGQAVVCVMPVVRRCVGSIDAERLDGVNQLQHPLDFRPAGEPQQNIAAWPYIGHGRAALARRNGTQDIDL